jgi:hypothetical protein
VFVRSIRRAARVEISTPQIYAVKIYKKETGNMKVDGIFGSTALEDP